MPYYIFPPDVLAHPPSSHSQEQQRQSAAATPSTKHTLYDPITLEHEHHNRAYGALLISTTCQCLQLSSTVTCTAQNIYHRFYCLQPQQHYTLLAVVLVCIGLASQLEEQIRTPTQVLLAVDRCMKLLHIHSQNSSDVDVAGGITATYRPLPILQRSSRRYDMFKRLYEQTEMVVLRTLNFTLYVQHPHSFLLHFINVLTPHMDVNHANVKYRQLAQLSWNTCNDLMLTVGPVMFKPADLTVAAIYTSAQVLDLVFPHQWYQFFDCQLPTIEAILQLLKEVHKLTGDDKQRILRYRPLSRSDAGTNPLMFTKPIKAITPAASAATVTPATANAITDLRSPSSNSVVSIDSVSSTPLVPVAAVQRRIEDNASSNGRSGHRHQHDDRRSHDGRSGSRDRSLDRYYSSRHERDRSRDRYDDRRRYR